MAKVKARFWPWLSCMGPYSNLALAVLYEPYSHEECDYGGAAQDLILGDYGRLGYPHAFTRP